MSVVINYDGFDIISYCTSADTEGRFSCMPELAKQINAMSDMIELLKTVADMDCMCLTKSTIDHTTISSKEKVLCLTCECKAILKKAEIIL